MGRAGSRLSPSACIRRIDHLHKKSKRDAIKPPYRCPICDALDAVSVHTHKKDAYVFKCRNGCFNEEVQIKSPNFEPIDGFNVLIDELHNTGKVL